MNKHNKANQNIKIIRIGNLPTNSNPGQGEACHKLFKSSYFQTLLFSPSRTSKDYYYEVNALGNKLIFLFFPNFVFPRKTNIFKKSFFSSIRLLNVLINSILILLNIKIYFYQIIHIHHIFFAIPAIFLKLTGKKIVITIHGSDIYKIRDSKVLRFILRKFDKILVVSFAQKKLLEEFITSKKIQYIGNGVDSNFYKPLKNYAERKNIILSIGSLRWQKNHKILVEAFNEIYKKYPQWKLVILGEGIERKNLEQAIKLNNLEDAISLEGSVNKTLLKEWLNKSKIFVLCSLTEGLPKALLEACACGCACISSNVGDCSAVLENIGLVTIPDNKKHLISCIERLICDSNLSNFYSIKAVEKVKKYSWDSYINIHKEIYDYLLEK